MMAIKGKYAKGTIVLKEPLDLEDGTEVEVVASDPLAASAGGWLGNVPDDIEETLAEAKRTSTREVATW